MTSVLSASYIGVVQRTRITVRQKLLDSGKKDSALDDEVFPRIHGFVFNLADGRLKKIPVDFEKRIGSLDSIYGLYPN
ncbi:hypothetical protein EON65_36725 [archaeon]|nr:MAG: hypothetical protein EON65_36725 [archaeon]